MIEVKFFDGNDTETIALMPSIDDAVMWVAAFLDLQYREKGHWLVGGDLYTWKPEGQRVLIASDTRSFTVRECQLIDGVLLGIEAQVVDVDRLRKIVAELRDELFGRKDE